MDSLDQALRVANTFVEEGVIVTLSVPRNRSTEEKRASKGAMGSNVPLVVLTDETTGSGGEIVAAGLKDLGRALLLGRQTAGVGGVSVVYAFGEADGSTSAYPQLTIARVLRAGGVLLDGVGVVPDVLVGRAGDAAADAGSKVALTSGLPVPGPTQERALVETASTWRPPAAREAQASPLLDDVGRPEAIQGNGGRDALASSPFANGLGVADAGDDGHQRLPERLPEFRSDLGGAERGGGPVCLRV